MAEEVTRWLADLSNPPPTAHDLAVWACEQATDKEWLRNSSARDVVLMLANMVIILDGKMREQHEAGVAIAARQDATRRALRDSAHTNVIALQRLEEQDHVVKAAIAWEAASRQGPSRDFLEAAANLRAEVTKHNSIVGARS